MCKDDYQRANLKMLPVMELDGKRTNRQILWHSALLIPVSLMPFYIGIMGPIYFWGAIILGILPGISKPPDIIKDIRITFI